MENSNETHEVQECEATCATHGPYMAKRTWVDLIGKYFTGTCPKCAEEHTAKDQAEEQRKQDERLERMRRNAGVPPRFDGKTLETFRVDTDKQQLALAACQRLVAALKSGTQAPNMVMIGKPGTGKSHLCCGMVLALYKTHKVSRIDLPDLIREIRSTWHRDSERSEDAVLNHYGSSDLLIIEEVGTGAGTDDERARIFQVINRRYEAMLPTVVVSNLDMEGLKKEIGDRVIDRLREGDRSLLVFDWPSLRGAA